MSGTTAMAAHVAAACGDVALILCLINVIALAIITISGIATGRLFKCMHSGGETAKNY